MTGNRSIFDYVVRSSVTVAPKLPKAPQAAPDEELDKDPLSDFEFADSDVDEGAEETAAKRQRQFYTDEKKLKALQLAVALGANNACLRLKVPSGTMSGWKRKLGEARKKRLLEAPENTPGLPVTREDGLAMLADGRAGNGNRVPLVVEQSLHTWFMHLRQTVCRCELT